MTATRRAKRSANILRWVVLGLAALYFLGPLLTALAFTMQTVGGGISFSAYAEIFATPPTGQPGFTTALLFSLGVAAVTIVLALGLLLPTQLLLALRLPRWRGVVDVLSLLPLVFPPVVLAVGVSSVYGWASHIGGPLFDTLTVIRQDSHPVLLALVYVVLAMPFVTRTLDAGLRGINVRTLTEASRNLGAGWASTLFRVIAPAMRTALVNAGFLCFALVLGEFTIATILLYNKPLPVWLVQLSTPSGQAQAAVSVFSLILVEALLVLLSMVNWRRSARNGR